MHPTQPALQLARPSESRVLELRCPTISPHARTVLPELHRSLYEHRAHGRPPHAPRRAALDAHAPAPRRGSSVYPQNFLEAARPAYYPGQVESVSIPKVVADHRVLAIHVPL